MLSEEPNFLGQTEWKFDVWQPSEYCVVGNHAWEDKLQRGESTKSWKIFVKKAWEIFVKKVVTTALNALHLTN